ncbi:MAG: protein-L-isoaspartate O-methyltransferase, partial [Deltaproteobacteria bacterium]|nr:protein-L-isoaspartate O-methyltransferase [Deltaproteobacteria bacterium]
MNRAILRQAAPSGRDQEPPPLPLRLTFPGSGQMAIQRRRMVETQLQGRDITDKALLKVMSEIPRHAFVDEAQATGAYSDGPLLIGFGQTISQPYIVAFMTQALELTPRDRVLEIGSGCGYHTAVLAQFAESVFAVELVPGLFEKGRDNIRKMGLTNVYHKQGDGSLGWPEMAPFTAVLAAAYGTRRPRHLLDQLAP